MGNLEAVISEVFIKFSKGRDCKKLEDRSLSKYGFAKFEVAWEVNTEIFNPQSNRVIQTKIFICFPPEFPLVIPKIYLSENNYKELGFLPHVDTDRLVCTFDEVSANFNPSLPTEIVEECFKRARQIIEKGLAKKNSNDIQEEFSAYWENEYSKKDSVLHEGLSIIENLDFDASYIPVIVIPEGIRGYKWILHNNGENSEAFKEYLIFNEVKFEESQAFFVKNIVIDKPPFEITHGKSIELLKNEDRDTIKRFINFNAHKLVVFHKTIKGQNIFYGWQYNNIKHQFNGFRPGRVTPFKAVSDIQRNTTVSRLTFENLTTSRLYLRSAGINSNVTLKTLVIAGLGSIGSQLIYFLEGLSFKKYYLIDNDILKVENITRHFIGINGVKSFKTDNIKNYILSKNPLVNVKTDNESVVKIIEDNVKFINEGDFFFVVIGNENIENYIGEKIQNGIITSPTFFIWVEPYLSAGHIIYVHPDSPLQYSDFFEDRLFVNNVIDKSEYLNGNSCLTKKEAGCQTSFIPYSQANIVLFLSAVYPYLRKLIENPTTQSVSITWIGDLSYLQSQNVKLSKLSNCNFGEIITKE